MARDKKKARETQPHRETDLHAPIHAYLEGQGYTVQAEVSDCDLVARKGDDLIVVEFKRRLSISLLVQATDRQRITESVYVALPGPLDLSRGSRWNGIRRLLRSLELGLITVTFGGRRPRVDVIFHPLPRERRKLSRRRRAVLREIDGRSESYNQGGSTRRKLMTAYREAAIRIATILDRQGPLTPRRLRALGTGRKTLPILADNHYGWFERVDRGVYALTPGGRVALGEYAELAERITAGLTMSEQASGDSLPGV